MFAVGWLRSSPIDYCLLLDVPMSRFVLLLHECPDDRPRPTHCDLMLQLGPALATWSLRKLPRDWKVLGLDSAALRFDATNVVDAERLADHRLVYLDYEGPLSGNRGTVRRLDAGTFASGPQPFTYRLAGEHIRGEVTLRANAGGDGNWQLHFRAAVGATDS